MEWQAQSLAILCPTGSIVQAGQGGEQDGGWIRMGEVCYRARCNLYRDTEGAAQAEPQGSEAAKRAMADSLVWTCSLGDQGMVGWQAQAA